MNQKNEIPVWETGMVELAPNVYAYLQPSGWGWSNAGLIVGKEYAIVVDTLFTIDWNQRFIEAIKKVTDKPVRYVINTHFHGDHTWGNHLFAGAEILCHDRCREEIVKRGQPNTEWLGQVFPEFDFTGVQYTMPHITFSHQLTLCQETREIRLVYYQPAHSIADIIVYLPLEGIVFCGDLLFLYATPLGLESDFAGWIQAMEKLASLKAKKYVPGHGPPCEQEKVWESRQYLVLIRSEARKRYEAGMGPREAALDIDLGEYKQWPNWERILANVERLYREFRGEEETSPMNVTESMMAMRQIAGQH